MLLLLPLLLRLLLLLLLLTLEVPRLVRGRLPEHRRLEDAPGGVKAQHADAAERDAGARRRLVADRAEVGARRAPWLLF